MTIRITAPRLLLAAMSAATLLSVPVVTAPPASAACTGYADPRTGVCWPQTSNSLGISGGGGTCFPGRLGLCLGALQNSPIPNLRVNPPAGPAPRLSWP